MLWKSRLLWMTWLRQPLAQHGDGRGFHKTHRLFTGVQEPPVGDVGNRGPFRLVQSRFSKTPELHSRDLENWRLDQVALLQPLRKDFHFSCLNYGYYSLVLYSYRSFPHPSRSLCAAPKIQPQPNCPPPTRASARGPYGPSLKSACTTVWNGAENSEMCPVFHPHW